MSRSITDLLAYLETQYALQPIPILVIHWPSPTGIKKYTNIPLTFVTETSLISISNLTSAASYKNFAQINSVSIVLQDFNQQLRQYVETHGFEGLQADVALTVSDWLDGEETILFTGKITAPISWNEKDRTLSFDVFSKPDYADVLIKLTSTVMASSPFNTLINLDKKALEDKCLPLILGSGLHVPVLRLTKQFEAILLSDIIYNHYSNTDPDEPDTEIILLDTDDPSLKLFEGLTITNVHYLEVSGHLFNIQFSRWVDVDGNPESDGSHRYAQFGVISLNPEKYAINNLVLGERVIDDEDYNNPKVFWLKDSGIILEGCTVTIGDSIDGYHVTMANYCEKQIGRKCSFANPWTRKQFYLPVNDPLYDQNSEVLDPEGFGYWTYPNILLLPNTQIYVSNYMPNPTDDLDYAGYRDVVADSDTKLIKIPAGTTIRYWDATKLRGLQTEYYFVNSIPTTLLSVNNGRRDRDNLIYEVPYLSTDLFPFIKTYYHIQDFWLETNYLVLILPIPLSEYRGEGWTDEIFVNIRSNVGIPSLDGITGQPYAQWGNVVQIIKWLIQHTPNHNYIVDNTSFNSVATLVTNYPASLVLFEEKNLFDLIGEIAWQARCALTLDGYTIKIKYLSKTPTTGVFTIDDDQVQQRVKDDEQVPALILEIPTTHELITKFRYSYQEGYNDATITKSIESTAQLPTILKPQGENIFDYTFFIYNKGECAQQSAIFWLNRGAYLWRRFTLNLSLEALNLEVFDIIKLDLPNSPIFGTYTALANNILYCPVISTEFDFEQKIVKCVLEIPVPVTQSTLNVAYWRVANIPLPPNPCIRDDKRFYDVTIIETISPHKLKHHKDIHKRIRGSSFKDNDGFIATVGDGGGGVHNTDLSSNDDMFQDGDVMYWSEPQNAFVPISAKDLVDAQGGSTSSTSSGLLSPHSHEGFWDGGWAGFNSGGK